MKTFLFDYQGTLVGNPSMREEDMKKVMLVLRAAGHRLVLWSGSGVGASFGGFEELVDEVWDKDMEHIRLVNSDFVVFDDDTTFLTVLAKHGAKIVGASQMGDWLVNESWRVGAEDPVTNFKLPATRLQQAERVRLTYAKLNTPENRAVLKRTFKHQDDVSPLARLYPMHRIYQVRSLALENVTYAGSVGFITSYMANGHVTLTVYYDRPGHAYTPVDLRSEIDPAWLTPISLQEFDETVKKDNPTICLA